MNTEAPMNVNDLSRSYFLDVCAAGTVHIRKRGRKQAMGGGMLPVFSTDTKDQAEQLRVLHCRLDRYGSGLYTLNDPPKSMDDLDRVSDLFRASYAKALARVESQF